MNIEPLPEPPDGNLPKQADGNGETSAFDDLMNSFNELRLAGLQFPRPQPNDPVLYASGPDWYVLRGEPEPRFDFDRTIVGISPIEWLRRRLPRFWKS